LTSPTLMAKFNREGWTWSGVAHEIFSPSNISMTDTGTISLRIDSKRYRSAVGFLFVGRHYCDYTSNGSTTPYEIVRGTPTQHLYGENIYQAPGEANAQLNSVYRLNKFEQYARVGQAGWNLRINGQQYPRDQRILRKEETFNELLRMFPSAKGAGWVQASRWGEGANGLWVDNSTSSVAIDYSASETGYVNALRLDTGYGNIISGVRTIDQTGNIQFEFTGTDGQAYAPSAAKTAATQGSLIVPTMWLFHDEFYHVSPRGQFVWTTEINGSTYFQS